DLRQPLLKDSWIDLPRMTISIAKKNLAISQYNLQLKMMQIVQSTQNAYYDLVAAEDNIKVQEKALELADRAYNNAKERVRVGTVQPLTEKSAQAALAGIRADLLAAQRQRDFVENVLKSLLSDHFEAWHNVTVHPAEKLLAIPQTYNLQASWLNGFTYRPDFNLARTEIERQGIKLKFAQNQMFPTLDITASIGRSSVDQSLTGAFGDISSGKDPEWSIGFVLNVPFTFAQERANVKIARIQLQQLELTLQQLRESILVSIDDSVKQAQIAYERIIAQREARSYNEIALEAEMKRMEAGTVTSYEVLQFQRDLTRSRGLEIQALADYNKALAHLYFNEGTILRRNGIELKVK
ncbi:MAG TPA: TolC family protein, partial [Verrucomicrobiae bacterium]